MAKEKRRGVITIFLPSSKKGQTFIDVLIIVLILFVSATSFVLVSYVQKEITAELQEDEEFNDTTAAGRALSEFDDNFTTTMDNTFLVVFILLWVFIIVSSLFVDANPIFLIISVILLIIVLIVLGVMSNAYEEFIFEEDIYTFAAGFPKMNYIMQHIVLFALFIGLSGILAIYGKNTLGGGGGY